MYPHIHLYMHASIALHYMTFCYSTLHWTTLDQTTLRYTYYTHTHIFHMLSLDWTRSNSIAK